MSLPPSAFSSGKSPLLRRDAAEWDRRLEQENHHLQELVRGTEADFLATGEGLQRLSRQLNGIQKECGSLTELTEQPASDNAVQFAFQLLKKSEDLMRACDEQYEHVFATFAELQQRLAQLPGQHAELMKVLQPLNYITICFRIESSRHAAAVQREFLAMADEVRGNVDDVRATMKNHFTEIAASERIARRLMEQVAASIQRHRKEIGDTLKTSRDRLQALSEALRGSKASAVELTCRNQAVTRHIGGIVMAQQCQDITRQRIEHVGEAMADMQAHLRETTASIEDAVSEPRAFVLHAAQIQLHQVKSVFDELNRAADGLKSEMKHLRREASAAADATVQVGRAVLDNQVADRCQAGIAQILVIVHNSVAKTGDVLAALAPLEAQFVDCTGKATALAVDVRHSGLNAQVIASRAADGAILVLLAEQVRIISDQAIQVVGRMAAALDQTIQMANNLRQRLEDFQLLGRSEHELLKEESARSQSRLTELQAAIELLIRRITGQQSSFAVAVEEVLTNVRFPVTVAAARARSISFFQELVTWSGAGGAIIGGDAAAGGKIDRLTSSYTMDSERLAHLAALQATASGSNPAVSFAPAVPVELVAHSGAAPEFGDNVDLF